MPVVSVLDATLPMEIRHTKNEKGHRQPKKKKNWVKNGTVSIIERFVFLSQMVLLHQPTPTRAIIGLLSKQGKKKQKKTLLGGSVSLYAERDILY